MPQIANSLYTLQLLNGVWGEVDYSEKEEIVAAYKSILTFKA